MNRIISIITIRSDRIRGLPTVVVERCTMTTVVNRKHSRPWSGNLGDFAVTPINIRAAWTERQAGQQNDSLHCRFWTQEEQPILIRWQGRNKRTFRTTGRNEQQGEGVPIYERHVCLLRNHHLVFCGCLGHSLICHYRHGTLGLDGH